ncbi:MAG: M56 family metallopeptidase, partial [Oscillospiraceae bacterium]
MLDNIVISVLNMSLIGSYVIALVLIARLLLKKAPKIFSYVLWGIVLFRLLCPFSFESAFSLIPMGKDSIPQDIIYSTAPQIDIGGGIADDTVNSILPAPNMGDSVNPLQIWLSIGTFIWMLGMSGMLIYSLVAFIKLKRSLIGAV